MITVERLYRDYTVLAQPPALALMLSPRQWIIDIFMLIVLQVLLSDGIHWSRSAQADYLWAANGAGTELYQSAFLALV
jgi:hypothetical protein